MEESKKEKVVDFLGIKVLRPLEERFIKGGTGHHDHVDEGRHHSHHDHEFTSSNSSYLRPKIKGLKIR